MAAGPIYLNTQSLERIRELARTGRVSDDALVVPYGEGKFYLATRQSRVAAFLPTFLNRLLKLTVHDGHEKAGRAYEIFKRSVEKSRGEAGSSVFQKRSIQPKKIGDAASEKFKLTLGYAAKIIESIDTDDPQENMPTRDRYVLALKKITKDIALPALARTIVARYLPDFRHEHVRFSYKKMLRGISLPKNEMEQITEDGRLLYQFRLVKMLITAHRSGLLLAAGGNKLRADDMTRIVEEIAKLAAYQTFRPKSPGRRRLERILTQGGLTIDKETVEGWQNVIKSGDGVTELPALDAHGAIATQAL